eukprot:GHVS01076510.1.p2 GENE.GHVS01076510.1~~GHVS01076510.1.p2  ORF type:complete len:109 (-),score=3.81 GHVS01076510.1:413-739(-)
MTHSWSGTSFGNLSKASKQLEARSLHMVPSDPKHSTPPLSNNLGSPRVLVTGTVDNDDTPAGPVDDGAGPRGNDTEALRGDGHIIHRLTFRLKPLATLACSMIPTSTV